MIECWLVGSYDSTSHNTSTMLQLYYSSFLLYFFHFFVAIFPMFPAFLPFFLYFSLFCCLVPLFPPYFLYLFLSTLQTTYWSYLGIMLCSSCLHSFIDRLILRRISILTTLIITVEMIPYMHPF